MNYSFFRFLLVGVINTIVGLSAMYVFLHGFSCSYWVSTFIGNTIGAIVSYFLNRTFTFKSKTAVRSSMFRFAVVILFCYFFSYFLGEKFAFFVFSKLPFFPKNNITDAAVLFGTGFYTVSNYWGQRLFVFHKKHTKTGITS